jgi:hypothetical protein
MKDIQSLLKAHKQLYSWSCSASAHEFIAKLHDKLNEADFPLQNDPASEKSGFQFESFLNGIGFTGHDDSQLPQDALGTFSKETTEERFPLVSILAGLGTSSTHWHIVVAVPSGAEVSLVDPARQAFITQSSAETLNLLQHVSDAVPKREKIHFLTYKQK